MLTTKAPEIAPIAPVGPLGEPPHAKYERLIAAAKQVPPAATVVVHPCDETSLRGAVDAAEAGIIKPILVGPAAKIADVARQFGLDIARYETVTTKIPSTIDAAALCKMADRGQITGGVLDGPLAFDNAIDREAARIKGINSPVAGRARPQGW
jgi:phosphate acetyltransferase